MNNLKEIMQSDGWNRGLRKAYILILCIGTAVFAAGFGGYHLRSLYLDGLHQEYRELLPVNFDLLNSSESGTASFESEESIALWLAAFEFAGSNGIIPDQEFDLNEVRITRIYELAALLYDNEFLSAIQEDRIVELSKETYRVGITLVITGLFSLLSLTIRVNRKKKIRLLEADDLRKEDKAESA